MIIGVKCNGCRMWTRLDNNGEYDFGRYSLLGKLLRQGSEPYYCDECNDNVTYHTTRATIKFE